MHNKNPFAVQIKFLSGVKEGEYITGFFHTNHHDRTLQGFEMTTDGPCFYCLTDDIQGVLSTDKINYKNKDWQIVKIISDDSGRSMIELQESIASVPWNKND